MRSLFNFSVWFFILFPVIFLLGIVFYYSETLFFADDFQLLDAVVKLQKPADLSQKLLGLIEQHNEHRILVPRLLTWLDYQLEGYINWRVLILFGNLVWCGILYFLWNAFRSLNFPVWFFLPVPWLLFHPIYFDNLTWTISVLQQSVIVFLLSWLVYAFTNRRFRLAIGIVLIATFTHGNGIFGFAIGLVFLVLYRDWRWLGIWLLLGLTTATVYFYGFAMGQSAESGQSFADPIRLVGYFLAFMGSIIQAFGPFSWSSALWGAVLLGGIGWFGWPTLYSHFRSGRSLSYFEKMLLGNLLFLVITALLVAVSRSWMASAFLIPSRYANYSPFLTCWFYLTLLSFLPRTQVSFWAVLWAAGGLLIWGISYLNFFTKLEYRRDYLRADKANWENHAVFVQYAPSFNRNIRKWYTEALEIGVCRISSDLPTKFQKIRRNAPHRMSFDTIAHFLVDAAGKHSNSVLQVYYHSYHGPTPLLVLLPAHGQPVWIAFYRTRNAYRFLLKGLGLRKEDMTTDIYTQNLPVGNFEIGIYSDAGLSISKYHLEVFPDHSIKVY